MKRRTRRKYSQEYRQEAIELARKLGASEASRKLDISLSNLQRWKSEKIRFESFGSVSFPWRLVIPAKAGIS